MKQTLSPRFWAFCQRFRRSWRQNWFSYTLLLIVLLAIWKKHQINVQAYLKQQPARVSSLALGATPEAASVPFTKEQVSHFYQRFGPTAQAEERKFGIPARLILAIALVQSEAGTSEAARTKNNYFHLQKAGKLRDYHTAWDSFRAFSLAVQAKLPIPKPQSDAEWIEAIAASGVLLVEDGFKDRVLGVVP